MITGITAALALLLLCEGCGAWVLDKLQIEQKGYAAPAGAAVLFALLEILYLPVMVLHLQTSVSRVLSAVAVCLTAALFFSRFRKTAHTLFRPDTLYIAAVLLLYTVLWVRFKPGMDDPEGREAVMILANAKAVSVDLKMFRLQGYKLFEAFFYWMLGSSMEKTVLSLSLFATGVASMLSMNIVNSFNLKNPWFRFTLISCALFYTEFYGWRITGAYFSENWRIIFTAMMLFTAYQWMKTGNEQIKYFLLIITGAGLACTNGFLIISIEIIYCLSVYLFRIQKIRSLFDVTTFLIPVVVYVSAWLIELSPAAGILLFVLYAAFVIIRYRRQVYTAIIDIEYFFIDHNRKIFWIVIPLIFLLGSLILRFLIPGRAIGYKYYLNYLVSAPVSNMIFLSRNVLDYVLDVFRLAGVIVFIMKAGKIREDRMVRTMMICMTIFFLNPLCMNMLASLTGTELYACGFEILFNPFTDILLFVWIYQICQWNVIEWVLELCLVGTALFGHIASFAGLQQGLYSDLVHPEPNASEVLP